MALIRSIADARKYVRLSNVDTNQQLPDIEMAEMLHLLPIIGQSLYDKLNTDYATLNDGSGVTAYHKVFRAAQRMIAPLAFANELGTYQALITSSGVKTLDSNSMQSAHQWEFKQLKDDLLNKSAQGMEVLILSLYSNSGSLPEWTASAEYQAYDKIAIRGANDFDKYYKLFDPYRTFHILKPIIMDVQEQYLVPVIGREMINWLKARADALITVDNVEVDMLVTFKKAIVSFTIKHALSQQSVRIDAGGFTVLASGPSDDNRNSGRADAGIMKYQLLYDEMEKQGQSWLADLETQMRGTYNGEFSNDFGLDFNAAFELGPLLPANITTPVIVTNNGNRNYFVLGG